MMKKIQDKLLTMKEPATYRIIVVGVIEPSFVNLLGGMHISNKHLKVNETETILIGQLPDQAALSGVLNSLYELHLPVSSVEFLY